MRLFTSRKSKYDALIKRLNSLSEITASTHTKFRSLSNDLDGDDDEPQKESGTVVIDINDEVILPPSGGIRHSGAPAVQQNRTKPFTLREFKAPNAKELLKNTTDFNEASEAISEIEGMYASLSAKNSNVPIQGIHLENRFKDMDLNAIKKLPGVVGGSKGVVTTTDSLIITLKENFDRKSAITGIKTHLKKVLGSSPMDIITKAKTIQVGSNEKLVIQFYESNLIGPATSKFLNEMRVYLETLTEAKERAEESLRSIAEDHVPDTVRGLYTAIVKHINNTLDPTNYTGLKGSVYVTSNSALKTGSSLEFTSYIEIEGLDKDEARSRRFFIVLTAVIKEEDNKYNMRAYVTSLKDFVRPGDFDVGEQLDYNEISSDNKAKTRLKKEISKLLALSGIQFGLSKQDIGISPSAFKTSGIDNIKGVIKSKLFNNIVTVLVNDMDNEIISTEILGQIILILRRLMRTRKGRDKSAFEHKIIKGKSGNKILVIAKVPR